MFTRNRVIPKKLNEEDASIAYTEAFCCTKMQYQLVKHIYLSMKALYCYSINGFCIHNQY